MAIIDLANPTRFLGFSRRLLPWLWGGAIVLIAAGAYMAFFVFSMARSSFSSWK